MSVIHCHTTQCRNTGDHQPHVTTWDSVLTDYHRTKPPCPVDCRQQYHSVSSGDSLPGTALVPPPWCVWILPQRSLHWSPAKCSHPQTCRAISTQTVALSFEALPAAGYRHRVCWCFFRTMTCNSGLSLSHCDHFNPELWLLDCWSSFITWYSEQNTMFWKLLSFLFTGDKAGKYKPTWIHQNGSSQSLVLCNEPRWVGAYPLYTWGWKQMQSLKSRFQFGISDNW